jgi:hypothetical protein
MLLHNLGTFSALALLQIKFKHILFLFEHGTVHRPQSDPITMLTQSSTLDCYADTDDNDEEEDDEADADDEEEEDEEEEDGEADERVLGETAASATPPASLAVTIASAAARSFPFFMLGRVPIDFRVPFFRLA